MRWLSILPTKRPNGRLGKPTMLSFWVKPCLSPLRLCKAQVSRLLFLLQDQDAEETEVTAEASVQNAAQVKAGVREGEEIAKVKAEAGAGLRIIEAIER